jgi:hypothetical protein
MRPGRYVEGHGFLVVGAEPGASGSRALYRLGEVSRLTGRMQAVFKEMPEERTEQGYRQEIAAYIDLCRQRFPRVLAIAASASLTPLTLRAQNLTAKKPAGARCRAARRGSGRGHDTAHSCY